jgi:mRNA interferase MazF
MVIHQGDIFWVDLPQPRGSETGFRRPHVVIQNNLFNKSGIGTVVACALSTNPRLAKSPGNVLLRKGEGGLPKSSVANISLITTFDKSELTERIGTLSQNRMHEILDGVRLILSQSDVVDH